MSNHATCYPGPKITAGNCLQLVPCYDVDTVSKCDRARSLIEVEVSDMTRFIQTPDMCAFRANVTRLLKAVFVLLPKCNGCLHRSSLVQQFSPCQHFPGVDDCRVQMFFQFLFRWQFSPIFSHYDTVFIHFQ